MKLVMHWGYITLLKVGEEEQTMEVKANVTKNQFQGLENKEYGVTLL